MTHADTHRSTFTWTPKRRFQVGLACVLVVVMHLAPIVLFFTTGAIVCRNQDVAEIEIKQLSNMVETYYLASSPRTLPAQLDELSSGENKLTEEVPKDPWGNPYIYVYTGERDFVIFSAGEDETAGTEDDIFEEGYR